MKFETHYAAHMQLYAGGREGTLLDLLTAILPRQPTKGLAASQPFRPLSFGQSCIRVRMFYVLRVYTLGAFINKKLNR
jgi:hypothetical protein